MGESRSNVWWSTFSAAIFVGSAVVAYVGIIPTPSVSITWRHSLNSGDQYRPSARVDTGPELTFVFVTSSTCGPSNEPTLPDTIENLKLIVQARAMNTGRSFAAIGVARDRQVEAGLRHLVGFGQFDEVSSGRGWLNMGLLKFVYEELPGVAATPQVVVVERFVSTEGGELSIVVERLLVRKVGLDEIDMWAGLGAPLPEPEMHGPQS